MLFYIPYSRPNRKLLFTWIFRFIIIGLCSVYLFKISFKKWKCFCSICHCEIASSAVKESSNCTTFGVIRSIYFIKLNTVHESLNVELNIENYYCWVDSQIVLAWIKATGKEFKTFVENRLNFIRRKVAPENWHYCQTDENPADVITRINNCNFIKNTLFWEGPEYLKKCFELQLTSNKEMLTPAFSMRRSKLFQTLLR